MSQLKRGAILSYVLILLTNTIGLILTPFIIKNIGDSEYGLYTLMGALVAQIAILNLGLNNAVIRFVSMYRAENDFISERNFLGTVTLVYVAISLLVLVIGGIIYLNIDEIFGASLTTLELERAKPLFLLLIFNLTITLPGGTFDAICNAYERFVFTRGLNIIKYISRAVLILALLAQYKSALFLVILDTILNLLVILITMYYVFKKLKIKFAFKSFDMSLVKKIFSYSIWVFIFAITYTLQWNSGQTILGLTNNTVTVAIFGVGVMLGGYYGAFAGAINTLLLPRATKMSLLNDSAESYTNEMIRIGRINALILFLILSGFFVFGKAFIRLWLGETYLAAWWIAILIMIAMTLPLLQAFGNSILEAKLKNRFRSILSLITLLIGVSIGYFLSKTYGMYGMIYPIVLSVILYNVIMSFYYVRIFDFHIQRFFREVFFKQTVITSILTFSVAYVLKDVIISTWVELFVGVSLFGITYLIVNYFFVLDETTKTLFFKNRL